MKFSHKIISFAITLLFSSVLAQGEAPSGYYSTAENKCGRTLLNALHNKISNHTTVSYKGLLDLYETSDVYPDGKIWDMYSTKHWNTGNTCGNYSVVGDCYNREHSFPKSWFNDASPMYSDAFHVYPTDGKVNGQRSNYPYGECANGTYLASNGNVRPLGKLGTSTFSGYSGKVFEPDDQYKGDFARSYFYMATAYYDKIANWDSPMLAGNNFPAFTNWAVNLLLKWHRQDPVSDKERNRNEAVYARQRNRNPYIDYPDLVEHIWGNKSTEAWSASGSTSPEFILPTEGTSLNFGTGAVGHPINRTLSVITSNAKENISVSISGSGFTASSAYLPYTTTNSTAGAELNISFNPANTGSFSGTLNLSCGNITRSVTLSGNAVNGLPAGPAKYISENSFQATWVYVGDDTNGNYTLDVKQAGTSINGYPCNVPAAAGTYTVDGLEPSTTYTYTVASADLTSDPVTVTTGDPIPSITFLFDGELYFYATPGEPSEVAELLMIVENIESNITIKVDAPFELSTNHSDWAQSISIDPEQGQFYLRLYSENEGSFASSLIATAGDYTTEGITIEGVAISSLSSDFIETFDTDATEFGSYNPSKAFGGSAARWLFSDTGIWGTEGMDDTQGARMGKTASSSITMDEDLNTGIGTVSFYAKYWGTEANPTIEVQYSTNGGEGWTTAGNVTVTSGSTFNEYSVFVGIAGTARIRLQQTSGKRLLIDNVSITRHSSGVTDPLAERHCWDAYTRNSEIFVNVANNSTITVGVYAIDGTTIFHGSLTAGEHSMGIHSPGLYIIAVNDFARRIVIQ